MRGSDPQPDSMRDSDLGGAHVVVSLSSALHVIAIIDEGTIGHEDE